MKTKVRPRARNSRRGRLSEAYLTLIRCFPGVRRHTADVQLAAATFITIVVMSSWRGVWET
jgi:hypothetical protein